MLLPYIYMTRNTHFSLKRHIWWDIARTSTSSQREELPRRIKLSENKPKRRRITRIRFKKNFRRHKMYRTYRQCIVNNYSWCLMIRDNLEIMCRETKWVGWFCNNNWTIFIPKELHTLIFWLSKTDAPKYV